MQPLDSQPIAAGRPPRDAARSPATLARRVADLVSLPEVYLRVRQLVEDPGSSLAEISDALSIDPGMTARLLRLANSAYYGFPARVQSVSRAVSLLGTRQVHDFVLATVVIRSFAGVPASLMDMRQFWQKSVLCGAATRVLADRCDVLDSERLFVAGLLAHVGDLVLLLQAPELVRTAHAWSAGTGEPLEAVTRELLGWDPAEVGGELLAAWNLPPGLVEPVRHHPCPAGAGERVVEASLVHVGVRIATAPAPLEDAASLLAAVDPLARVTLALGAETLAEVHVTAHALGRELTEIYVRAPA